MLFVNEKFLYRVVHHPHAQNQYWYLIHKGLPTQHKEHKFETHYCYPMVVSSCARLMSCLGVWLHLLSINLYTSCRTNLKFPFIFIFIFFWYISFQFFYHILVICEHEFILVDLNIHLSSKFQLSFICRTAAQVLLEA